MSIYHRSSICKLNFMSTNACSMLKLYVYNLVNIFLRFKSIRGYLFKNSNCILNAEQKSKPASIE